MTVPKNNTLQIEYKNPHATGTLMFPMLVICNTSDEMVEKNIRDNSAKPLKWLEYEEEHDGIAVMVGGGASIEDEIDNIIAMKERGATIFAMNAASAWLSNHGIEVDFQCIADAKEETSQLIDYSANAHIIASQAHSTTMDAVTGPIVWHLGIAGIEDYFPPERVKRGGYVILGGGTAVGNSSMCVAYAKGFRDIHVFGFDSCHRDGRSHAYTQNMNVVIPTTIVKWGGREFLSSVTMKAHAERFQFTASSLKELGCTIQVYGDGLLQSMYNTKADDLTEKQKYQMMWEYDAYRYGSPGEDVAQHYLDRFKPKGMIIDFGCGTGRAGVKFVEAGYDVLLIDFTDNCRDEEAIGIPFMQWDLTKPCTARSENGFCTDVMEHIPTKDVGKVIKNIMSASKKVFFQISTVDDCCGALINVELHLTVKPHKWWLSLFKKSGYKVDYDENMGIASIFYVTK